MSIAGLSWHDALTRRLRSLLKSGPFHQLRANEGRHRALCEHDDTTALCMKAIEILIDAMGLRPGATRNELAEALKPLIHAGDELHGVEPDSARHQEVIDIVLGTLLNDAGRRQAYSADYNDFIDGHLVARTLKFRIASEQEALDGSIVIRAEPDGVNLFLRSLDIELEDAQAATEAVIRAQLERGRLDLALQSAREARIRSLQYYDKVHAQLRRTRRDVGRVDWRFEVPTLIEESLKHLEGRLLTEREIRESAQSNLEELLGTAEALTLASICDLLDECFDRHLELHRSLMTAYEVFRSEQERQRFAPIPVRALPALEKDLLEPVLVATHAECETVVTSFSRSILPASAPLLLDVGELWKRLLKPPRERSSLGRSLVEANELESVVELPPLFDEELATRVDLRLAAIESKTTLSALLEEASGGREAHFTVMRALQHFAPESGDSLPIQVERIPVRLQSAGFFGDDLCLRSRTEADTDSEVSHG